MTVDGKPNRGKAAKRWIMVPPYVDGMGMPVFNRPVWNTIHGIEVSVVRQKVLPERHVSVSKCWPLLSRGVAGPSSNVFVCGIGGKEMVDDPEAPVYFRLLVNRITECDGIEMRSGRQSSHMMIASEAMCPTFVMGLQSI
jgi:hypothetical protein